ncbi:hypothetical protein BS78_01G252900 [Paspalum vaginatum]|nr:hypothetical protein BS78_01G252900 [Paspalum vaginatum]
MKPSRSNLSASVVLLVAAIMAGGGMLAEADDYKCYKLSGVFKGWCWSSSKCSHTCSEFEDHYDGKCRGWLPARCWCRTCPHTPAAAAPAPATIESGDGGGASSGAPEYPTMDNGWEFPAPM